MLSELILENFILTKRASFPFESGFTVITGPTGAGKSLLVKALKLILGDRADTSVVRPGAEYAVVQALFEVPSNVREALKQQGIESDGEMIIRRIITTKGKGKTFINGNLVSLQQAKKLTKGLVTIASQHEFQNLLRRERHLTLLDNFGNLESQCNVLAGLHADVMLWRKKLERLEEQNQAWEEEKKKILAELRMIDEVAPQEHEEEELEQERSVLKASSLLRELGEGIYRELYSAQGSITERLSSCRADMEKMAGIDTKLSPLQELLDSTTYQASDLALSLRDYLHGLPVDLSRLDQVEERLFRLQEIKRKFGPEIRDVLEHREKLQMKLDEHGDLEIEITNAAGKLEQAEDILCREAEKLSIMRHEAAKAMEQAVMKELSFLDLKLACLQVRITSPEEILPDTVGPSGADKVEFFFSANPGQPLRPLAKVASGGELSRVLLAVKTVTGGKGMNQTMVFDEIDTGLGGEIAENVGRKLRSIGKDLQVIAITHFPQIASMGQGHLAVEKRQQKGTTVMEVKNLSDEERPAEIMRMLGGDTETAEQYANELLGPVLRRT